MIWRKAAPSLPPLLARLPRRDPLAGPGQQRGWSTGRDAEREREAGPSPASLWVGVAPKSSMLGYETRLSCLAHGTARHGTLSSQMHTPRSQPSAAGGAGRWLQALPEPSPTRRCDKHPMEPAANPVKSPGAGMELGGDPACCFPTPILSPGAGGTEPGGHRGGWAPSLSVPLTPRAPCSHLPGAATPDGCRMLGRRDFPDVN